MLSNSNRGGFHSPVVVKRPQVSPLSNPLFIENERGPPTPPIRTFKPHLWVNGESTGVDHMPVDRGPNVIQGMHPIQPVNFISNPFMDRGIQSSLPSLVSEPINRLCISHGGPQFNMEYAGIALIFVFY